MLLMDNSRSNRARSFLGMRCLGNDGALRLSALELEDDGFEMDLSLLLISVLLLRLPSLLLEALSEDDDEDRERLLDMEDWVLELLV